MQKFLYLTYALTNLGLLAELVLLEHMESVWQWVPLAVLSVAFLAMAANYRGLLGNSIRPLMLLVILTGLTGIYLHYHGNSEFELEMYPSLANFELFINSIKGATPVLAPGAMVGLGMLGWALTIKN